MRGIWTALITPFDNNHQIDLAAYKRLLAWQAASGVTGVIPCGTTGESATLSMGERKTLITTALEVLQGTGVQVIAGTGTNDTARSIELSVWADQQGVDGLLIVTPYYNKPSQAGLEAHYTAIANTVGSDIILYNVPGRTAINLAPETIVRLAKHPKIRAIKEASGNVATASEIRFLLAEADLEMDLLAGDDALFLPLLSVGATGVVSVASNLIPKEMVLLLKAFESGNMREARKIHDRNFPVFRDLFIESNPSPIKQAMHWAGWCEPTLRLPMVPLNQQNQNKLRHTLDSLDLLRKGTDRA